MIVVVTPNPAFDVTYHVEHLEPGAVHRVRDRQERAGGKGLNVASVLRQLDEAVLLTGLLPSQRSQDFRDLVAASLGGVDAAWVSTPGRVRTSVTVVDETDATVLNEAGEPAPPGAWHELAETLGRVVSPGDVVVFSGSLPATAPPDAIVPAASVARQRGARVIIDTSGPALTAAAEARPALVKPNREELSRATGIVDPVDAALELVRRGCGAVAVSLAADGALLITAEGRWRATPPGVVHGNPTGAGDASVAGWARALAHHQPLADALAHAVALGAAAVAMPTAGAVDLALYRRLAAQITVEESDASR